MTNPKTCEEKLKDARKRIRQLGAENRKLKASVLPDPEPGYVWVQVPKIPPTSTIPDRETFMKKVSAGFNSFSSRP